MDRSISPKTGDGSIQRNIVCNAQSLNTHFCLHSSSHLLPSTLTKERKTKTKNREEKFTGGMSRSGSGSGSSRRSRTARQRQPQPQQQPEVQNNFEGIRMVNSGRPLNLTEGLQQMVMNQLQSMGWHNYADMIGLKYHRAYVNEFYRRAHFFYTDPEEQQFPVIRSSVNGTEILLNCNTLALHLNLPNSGEKRFFLQRDEMLEEWIPGYTRESFLRRIAKQEYIDLPFEGDEGTVTPRLYEKYLLDHLILVNTFFTANVIPSAGRNNFIPVFHQYVLYCIQSRIQLNLPYIMLHLMNAVLTDMRKHLPFACLLTQIFGRVGVDINEGELEKGMGPLNDKMETKIKSHLGHPENFPFGTDYYRFVQFAPPPAPMYIAPPPAPVFDPGYQPIYNPDYRQGESSSQVPDSQYQDSQYQEDFRFWFG